MTIACFQPGGYVTNNSDCDDGFFAIKPCQEVCDGVDNDCDSNRRCQTVVLQGSRHFTETWMQMGTAIVLTRPQLFSTIRYTSNSSDCNDSSSSVYPGHQSPVMV